MYIIICNYLIDYSDSINTLNWETLQILFINENIINRRIPSLLRIFKDNNFPHKFTCIIIKSLKLNLEVCVYSYFKIKPI